MPLIEQDKTALIHELAPLVEANEPEAILATLERFAVNLAQSPATDRAEAERWRSLAKALEAAQHELERLNRPAGRAEHERRADQEPESGDSG